MLKSEEKQAKVMPISLKLSTFAPLFGLTAG
jgi:hypothetical protein